MPMDGLTLSFVRDELATTLIGGRVDKITQPERDEIIIALRSLGKNRALLISINPNCARIHLTGDKRVSPLEPSNFCMLMRKHLQGGKLTDVRQIGGDRILEIDVENRDDLGDLRVRTLILEIMGRHSNLMLVNWNGKIIDSLRHVTDDISRVREVLPGLDYQRPPAQDKLPPENLTAEALTPMLARCPGKLSKAYAACISGVSIQAAREITYRLMDDEDAHTSETTPERAAEFAVNYLRDMRSWTKPTIVFDSDGAPLDFMAFPYECRAGLPSKSYDSMCEMMDAFFMQRDLMERISQKSAALNRVLHSNIERCEKKLGLQLDALREGDNCEDYRIKGELLMAQLYAVTKGAKNVTLDNYYDENGGALEIELDVKLSPAANAQKYFKLYQKAKSAQHQAAEQVEKTNQELYYLEGQLDNLQKCTDESELNEVREELVREGYLRANHNRRTLKKLPPSLPYHFIAPDGTDILIGKNNVQNDQLTRTAEPNDTWLHVKDMPGSHVIVCARNPSDETLLLAAQLAAWFSKGQHSSQVPVDYTLRKYVKKPAGAKPGFVIYTHQTTLFVTPDETILKGVKQAGRSEG